MKVKTPEEESHFCHMQRNSLRKFKQTVILFVHSVHPLHQEAVLHALARAGSISWALR